MKKIFFILTVFSCSLQLAAQEPADALRNSWTTQNGSARTQAIGGAIGALGGDITSAFVNPAGLGFYKTGDFVFTPGYSILNNKSTYYGTQTAEKKSRFLLGTTGFVVGFANGNKKKLRSSSFGIAVNRTADFNNNILYKGAQHQSSYSQKFLEEIRNNNDRDANNVSSGVGNYAFGTSLAFNTYWIDTVGGGSSGNYQFQTRAPVGTGLLQQNMIDQKGGITELAFAGAANINDKVYYGLTLGIPFLSYRRTAEFLEADAGDVLNGFNYAAFSENLKSTGVGLNLKGGVIFKPVESLRLGLSLHSPTFFSLEDKYTSSVTADTEDYQGLLTQNSADFDNGTSAFKYTLLTPYRVIVSAAYVLHEVEDVTRQKGFLTADIEYVNYKAMSFHTDAGNENDQGTKDYLKTLNKAIDNAYKGVFNVRLGGELKFNTVMVRLGGAYYGNPYKDINGEKGSRLQVTGGLGYRNKGMFIDLGYVHNIRKDVNFGYRLEDKNLYKGAEIKGTGGNVVLTLGVKI